MKKIKLTTEQYNRLIRPLTERKIDNLQENFVSEDIFSPEVQDAVNSFLKRIWENPSQKGLDRFFIENDITWGDIITYLTSIGILASVGAGIYKIRNILKRKFSKDPNKEKKEKEEVINIISNKISSDPEAPWNKKIRLQQKPESKWEAKPKPFNPNQNKPWANENETSEYEPLAMNDEIILVSKGNDKYVFFYDEINQLVNSSINDIVSYINNNDLRYGKGLSDFESGKADLILIDDELKNELISLYSKNKNIINSLNTVDEITSATSSGSFVAPLSLDLNDEEQVVNENPIEEITTSSSSGSYVQPKIFAKDKNNWIGAKKTQYPNGEMVKFDDCTKLNNNKKAQNGGCSQGAIDNVVKTYKTKNSVISK